VGIAFQGLKSYDIENIGYIIPIPVVEHFLNDIEKNGRYSGFCCAGFSSQKMENKDLRKFYGLAATQSGILVKSIQPLSDAATKLKKEDILLKFDGISISSDGTIPFAKGRNGERILWSYLVSCKYVGDYCTLELLREKQVIQVELRLGPIDPLVPLEGENRRDSKSDFRIPSYFIIAGFVFVPLCACYLAAEYPSEDVSPPARLLDLLENGVKKREGEQVVILSQTLAHNVNVGYDYLHNIQVFSANGTKIHNLKHLAELVDNNKESYLRFDLFHGETIILDYAEALAASADILKQNNIAHYKSADLM